MVYDMGAGALDTNRDARIRLGRDGGLLSRLNYCTVRPTVSSAFCRNDLQDLVRISIGRDGKEKVAHVCANWPWVLMRFSDAFETYSNVVRTFTEWGLMVKEWMLKPGAITHRRMVWKPAVRPPDPSLYLFFHALGSGCVGGVEETKNAGVAEAYE